MIIQLHLGRSRKFSVRSVDDCLFSYLLLFPWMGVMVVFGMLRRPVVDLPP